MKKLLTVYLSLPLILTGCASVSIGNQSASSPATGAAAGSTAVKKNKTLVHCDYPLGTVAVEEDPNSDWYLELHKRDLGPITPVLRLIIQQSNCFVVVERGRAFNSLLRERKLMKSGELRKSSNFHKHQLASADYTVVPTITFSQKTGGAAGSIAGAISPIAGLIAGAVKTQDASVTLELVDNRSGVQIAASQGSARGFDIGGLGGLLGGSAFAGLGAYSKTPEGKVLVASFIDAYNNMVRALKSYKMQKVKGGLGTGGELKVQGSK
ncbi:MAG: peptidoglycan-binding protein [Nitrospiraceae bacterium]|nr:peptidoglycan-binding protein [Nitrospiraceae bacterium]